MNHCCEGCDSYDAGKADDHGGCPPKPEGACGIGMENSNGWCIGWRYTYGLGCCVSGGGGSPPNCVCPCPSNGYTPDLVITGLSKVVGEILVPNKQFKVSWNAITNDYWNSSVRVAPAPEDSRGFRWTSGMFCNKNSSYACWTHFVPWSKRYEVWIGPHESQPENPGSSGHTVFTSKDLQVPANAIPGSTYKVCVRGFIPGSLADIGGGDIPTESCDIFGPWACIEFKIANLCGNNACDPGETCDYDPAAMSPYNPASFTCPDNGIMPVSTGGYCREPSLFPGAGCTYCGDGIVQMSAGEQCDGNPCANGAPCRSDCKCPEPGCGNGICEAGETCDPGLWGVCTGSGFTSGTCRSDCTYCGDGIKNGKEECDPRATPTGCSGGNHCTTSCTCVPCSCNCACPPQNPVTAPSLVSPADNATRVSTARIEFSWNALPSSAWEGVTGVSCNPHSDSNKDGTCDCDFIYNHNVNRRYEVLIAREGTALPRNNESCLHCESTVLTNWTYDSRSSKLQVGFPLEPGTNYVWAVRGVNPGGGGGDIDCPRYGDWTVRRFRTSYAPTVDSVSVLIDNHITCFLPNSGGGSRTPSRWTGDHNVAVPNVESVPNNPISIRVTVSDQDGADDIEKVWLNIGNAPGNLCDSSDYVAVGAAGSTAWTACPKGSGGNCGGSSPTACNNEIGCKWDYQSRSCVSGGCKICHGAMGSSLVGGNYSVVVSGPQASGTSVSYIFTITFEDTYQEGIQTLYGMAFDGTLFSGGGNGLGPNRTSGEQWGFDFHGPAGELKLYHTPGTLSNQVELHNVVIDDLSGVRHFEKLKYGVNVEPHVPVVPGGGWFNVGLSTGLENGRRLNGEAFSTLTVAGLKGGDVVNASDQRDDLACNTILGEGDIDVGLPWLETFKNSVYGYGGFYDPIPVGPVPHALSEYWIGGGNSLGRFNAGFSSLRGWYSTVYEDWNRNDARKIYSDNYLPWYQELKSLAMVSSWMGSASGAKMQDISIDDVSDTLADLVEGIYEVTGNGNINLGSGTCVGRKIFFIPSGVTLTIEPDLNVSDASSACLFILEGENVTIGEGNDQKDISTFDAIHSYIVSDGRVAVVPDRSGDRYDRLEIFGSIFSNFSDFSKRDLVFEDNMTTPAVKITYDPRGLALFRDMIGRRPYSELECGIVKGSSNCEGWVETTR